MAPQGATLFEPDLAEREGARRGGDPLLTAADEGRMLHHRAAQGVRDSRDDGQAGLAGERLEAPLGLRGAEPLGSLQSHPGPGDGGPFLGGESARGERPAGAGRVGDTLPARGRRAQQVEIGSPARHQQGHQMIAGRNLDRAPTLRLPPERRGTERGVVLPVERDRDPLLRLRDHLQVGLAGDHQDRQAVRPGLQLSPLRGHGTVLRAFDSDAGPIGGKLDRSTRGQSRAVVPRADLETDLQARMDRLPAVVYQVQRRLRDRFTAHRIGESASQKESGKE